MIAISTIDHGDGGRFGIPQHGSDPRRCGRHEKQYRDVQAGLPAQG